MAVVKPYVTEHEPAVAAFNERLAAGGSGFSFRPHAPQAGDTAWSAFLAVDTDKATGASAVRGGYLGVRHPFRVAGEDSDVHHLKLPLSEGTVDPKYNAVGLQLLVDAQRRYPMAFALGMGGRSNALPKMLEGLGWRVLDVPFFFRVARPSGFLKNVAFLRTSRERKLALDVAAYTGAGLAILPVHAWLGRRSLASRPARAELVPDFDRFADRIWEVARGGLDFVMRRDAARLRELYPASDARFLRLQVVRDGDVVGWAVCLDTQMSGHKQFGDMRLGSLVDCLSLPGAERDVVRAATRFLRRRRVDLMVTNQCAPAFCRAMHDVGWIERPSNYALALSKKLAAKIGEGAAMHVTRGDGDGPINL